jgi:hypothetical protein
VGVALGAIRPASMTVCTYVTNLLLAHANLRLLMLAHTV